MIRCLHLTYLDELLRRCIYLIRWPQQTYLVVYRLCAAPDYQALILVLILCVHVITHKQNLITWEWPRSTFVQHPSLGMSFLMYYGKKMPSVFESFRVVQSPAFLSHQSFSPFSIPLSTPHGSTVVLSISPIFTVKPAFHLPQHYAFHWLSL